MQQLIEKLEVIGFLTVPKICEEFLEIEKQQIVEAVDYAISDTTLHESFRELSTGENYYNETFKQDTP